ncbi:MAG TPA: trigger factor [Acidobacteriaceae bacterium]|nr:trigger factor [Acidobacteriaceae bacterium]
MSTQELSNPELSNPDTAEIPTTPETTPAVQAETAQGEEHGHDHDGHDHAHQDAPTFNPEVTRSVEVTIPADEVSKAMRSSVKRYQKQARIPGFRSGKVPESLIRARFAEGIRQEVLEAVMPKHFQGAITEGNFRLVSQPQVVDMKMEDDQPLWFKASFEVMPEFSVEGYQNVKVEKPSAAFTDDEFASEVERVRDSRSTMEPVEEERPLVDGDWAQITFTGSVQQPGETENAKENAPLSGEDVMLEVGGSNTLSAFTDALRGSTVGQELKFEVNYPEDFGEKRLAGKNVAYDVTVKAIKRRVQPELNDDFAKELGDYSGYEDFTTKFRENLQTEKDRRTETDTRDRLLTALSERFQFPVPESMIQQQIDTRLDRGLRSLAAQGMREEDMKRLDFARLRAAQRDSATSEVKSLLILDRIADAEQIGVSDEEVSQELELLSLQLREPVDALRVRLTQDGSMARIREQIRRDKTAKLLYERL